MAEGEPLRAGSTVGGYVIEAELGRGGMGVVYRATQRALGRAVALKVIAPELARDETFRRRFERESRVAASIEHPNVVPIYEAGEEGATVFIAMRQIDGTDLRALLRAERWLEPERAAALVDQVADALDAAHARGLVHRDVKPANVLLGEAGGREWAYLTDFGLTKPASGASELTGSGQWLGTLDYASPEQIQGKALDARSDVYSLGCVLFEALSGRIPFERKDDVAKLYAHVHDEPPPLAEAAPDAPAALDGVVRRALAKDPGDRFPSAGDLGRAAVAAARDEPVTERERSVAVGEAAPGTTRRLPKGRLGARPSWAIPLAALAGLAALVALAIAAVSIVGDEGPAAIGETAVGKEPIGLSVGAGVVWVTNAGDDTVSRIDAASGEPIGDPIDVGDRPAGIKVAGGSVWVAISGENALLRLDADGGDVRATIPVPGRPAGVTVGEGAVWVTSADGDTVSRIDPAVNRIAQRVPVGADPAGVAVGEGSVWVANSGVGTATRILPGSADPVGEVRVGVRPRGIATGEGAIWVANALDATVSRIDPVGREQATIGVGERPAQIAVGEGYVWVADEDDGTVSRIDPADDAVAGDPIEVGDGPRGVAIGEGLIWVANSGDGTVSRIEP